MARFELLASQARVSLCMTLIVDRGDGLRPLEALLRLLLLVDLGEVLQLRHL